ncbi:MAG TPA: hypothetical protein VKU00_10570, partial [Chthonomonadaceae bacterium]|nr:hypothetical protein [Chthonomonadaceae bacterium]
MLCNLFWRGAPGCLRFRSALGMGIALLRLAASGARAFGRQEPTPSQGNPKPAQPGAPDLPPRALLLSEINSQATRIDQLLFPYRSPYEGPNSLCSRSGNEKSDTYTQYLGVRLTRGLGAFVTPARARGNGLSEALGLAGFIHGHVMRNPTLG